MDREIANKSMKSNELIFDSIPLAASEKNSSSKTNYEQGNFKNYFIYIVF